MKLFGNNHNNKHVQPQSDASGHKSRSHIEDTQELSKAYKKAAAKKKAAEEATKVKKGRKGLLIVLIILVALIVAGVLWYRGWREPPEIGPGVIHTPDATPEQPSTDLPEQPNTDDPVTEEPDEPVVEKPEAQYNENGRKIGTYTFLLIGSDNGFGNTDTILYAVFDTVDHTLNVVNIPRDTMMNVPWSIKRINAVYANSGNDMARLRREVGNLVGYEIDESYAIVDLEAFVEIVDCIGGVDYNVPIDMYDYLVDQDFNIAVPAGFQHLDGEKALQVVRFRAGYLDADIGRINTQQDFLMAVAKQMLSLKNIPNLPQLYKIIEEYVETNLSTANMAFFIEEFLKMAPEDIHFYTVPGDGQMVKGGSYYFVRSSEWVNIVNSGLNPFNTALSAMNMNYLVYQNGDVYTSRGEYYGTETFLDYQAYINELLGKNDEQSDAPAEESGSDAADGQTES